MAEVIPTLFRVQALVRGQPLLAGLSPDAQPLASLRAELRGGAVNGRALAGIGRHDVTAAAPAGVPADPCARLQGLRLGRAVAVSNERTRANCQRYGDGRYSPASLGTLRAPSGASHSSHGPSWRMETRSLAVMTVG